MEKHEYPEILEVTITGADLKDAVYRKPKDCPLARALKRMFPNKDILVGPYDVDIDKHERLYIVNDKVWTDGKVLELQQAQKNKKKCTFTVVLKRSK